MGGIWRIQEDTRQYHNSVYDLIDVHIIYSADTAVNQYLILKHETTIQAPSKGAQMGRYTQP